ncbi:hypothetical protein CL614_09215 [archaeon]|nr:hypothetical protein [archaeon]|tara:strand:- start:2348 stop:2599 length:252 start_codon:yes stop_codon:yes gene_type:complete
MIKKNIKAGTLVAMKKYKDGNYTNFTLYDDVYVVVHPRANKEELKKYFGEDDHDMHEWGLNKVILLTPKATLICVNHNILAFI